MSVWSMRNLRREIKDIELVEAHDPGSELGFSKAYVGLMDWIWLVGRDEPTRPVRPNEPTRPDNTQSSSVEPER